MKKNLFTLLFIFAALIAPQTAATALAADLTVTKGDDNVSGSLRDILSTAQNGDHIIFDGVTTVTLTGDEILIDQSDITIDGGSTGVTITRQSGTGRLLNSTATSGTLTLKGLTLTNGNSGSSDGGAINASSNVDLENCIISGNSAYVGGGIYAGSTATLTNCTVSGNSSTGYGGGIYTDDTATLIDCTVSGNSATSGGGIFATTAATLTNCTVSGNSASADGGGIATTTTRLINCTVSGNSAQKGGGIAAFNPVVLLGTVVSGNYNSSYSPSEIGKNNTEYNGDGALKIPGDVFDAFAAAESAYFIVGVPSDGLSKLMQTTVDSNGQTVGKLANNGGNTQTILPTVGGILTNAVLRGETWQTATDQRGVARPTTAGIHNCTGGAVEVNSDPGDLLKVVNGKSAGAGSLASAVGFANSMGTAATITFDPGVTTVTLTGSEISITQSGVIIDGGSTGVTITRPSGSTGRLISSTATTGTLTLKGLTLSNGNGGSNGGGAIYTLSDVYLENCIISDNSANAGGGIFSNAATLTNCTVSGNSATNNNGGGIFSGSTVTLTNCTVSGNSATFTGGGIFAATATLINCTVSGNSAQSGGGILATNSVVLQGTIVSGNYHSSDNSSSEIKINSTEYIGNGLLQTAGGSFGTTTTTSAYFIVGIPSGGALSDLLQTDVSGKPLLANNSGSMPTIRPAEDSPMLYAVPAAMYSATDWNTPTDQLGGARPTTGYGTVGAVQVDVDPADMLKVVNGNSAGAGSLASAVAFANRMGTTAATITFDSSVTTVMLTGDAILFTNPNVTIDGGSTGVTISRQAGTTGRLLYCSATSGTLTLKGLTLTNGNTNTGNGGAIYTLSNVDLENCIISDNSAYSGGGIYANGTATLTNCTVSGNSATYSAGGGIQATTAILTNCTVSGNSATTSIGGCIYASSTATLTNCTVSGNSAYIGGGIYATNPIVLQGTIVSGNSPSEINISGAEYNGDGLLQKSDGAFGTKPGSAYFIIGIPLDGSLSDLMQTTTDGNNHTVGKLAGNSGGMPTIRPAEDSPMLYAVPAAMYSATDWNTPTDQLGGARPTTGYGTVGAVQVDVDPATRLKVVNGNSAGAGSLASAVAFANYMGTAATITFDQSVTTVTLTGNEILITNPDSITIDGGSAGVTITRQSGTTGRLINSTAPDGTLTLKRLKLTNGGVSGSNSGGAILAASDVILENCIISGNSAYDGGGIFVSGTLTLTNCTVSGNSATNNGGGIYANSAATLTNCTISDNNTTNIGGGIYAYDALTLINCTVSGNSASLSGGIFVANTVVLQGTVVSGNYNNSDNSPSEIYTDKEYIGDGTLQTAGGTFGTSSTSAYFIVGIPLDGSLSDLLQTTTDSNNHKVGKLAGNSGGMPTIRPAEDSPMLYAVPATMYSATYWNTPTDQLGGVRPTTGYGTVGAVQVDVDPADMLKVINGKSAGAGSLASAVAFANYMGTAATITFDQSVTTVTLTGNEILITNPDSITIDGGSTGVTITRQSGTTGRLINSSAKTGTLTLKGLTLTNGNAGSDIGGAIYTLSNVDLENCIISDNSASSGGGICADSTATLTNCTVSGNSASNGGGGIYATGIATLTNCMVSGNSATAIGGGIYDAQGTQGTLTLTNCTVSGNSTSGAGGGIVTVTATLTNCTVSGNSANLAGGGIIATTTTLTNCTVSGNSANLAIGGIAAINLVLQGTIVSGNYNSSVDLPSEININNSAEDIIGDGRLQTGSGAFGTASGSAYFIVGIPSDGSLSDLLQTTTDGNNHKVGKLADNGGTTQTILPAAGSPMLGAVPATRYSSSNWNTATDQRGKLRPTTGYGTVGAVEATYALAPTLSAQPQDLTIFYSETDKSLSATANVTDGGTLSYQWYSNTTASNAGGSLITNATGSSYTPPATAIGVKYYYVAVTNTKTGLDIPTSTTTVSNVAKVTVNLGTQTLSITGLKSSYTYGDAAFTIGISGDTGTGGVTYTSSDPTVASVSGSEITIHKAGTFKITAKKAADGNYAEASATSGTISVNKAAPTLALSASPIGNQTRSGDVTLTAVLSGTPDISGQTVTFTVNGSNVGTKTTDASGKAICTVSSPAAGTYSFGASFAGDTNNGAATATNITNYKVNLETQATLSITGLNGSYTYGDPQITLSYTGGTGGGGVTYVSSDPTVASVSGSEVTILKAGSFKITATKAADINYAEATATSGTIAVGKALPGASLTATGGASPNDDVVLTAEISGVGTGVTPSGDVTFKEGATTLGTATLNSSGITTCTVKAPISAGNHTYTAEYAGDGNRYASNTASCEISIVYTDIKTANAPSIIVYSQHGNLIVKSESTIQRIMVYNISGQLIKEVKPGSNYIEISGLPKTQVLIVNVMVDGKVGSYKVEID